MMNNDSLEGNANHDLTLEDREERFLSTLSEDERDELKQLIDTARNIGIPDHMVESFITNAPDKERLFSLMSNLVEQYSSGELDRYKRSFAMLNDIVDASEEYNIDLETKIIEATQAITEDLSDIEIGVYNDIKDVISELNTQSKELQKNMAKKDIGILKEKQSDLADAKRNISTIQKEGKEIVSGPLDIAFFPITLLRLFANSISLRFAKSKKDALEKDLEESKKDYTEKRVRESDELASETLNTLGVTGFDKKKLHVTKGAAMGHLGNRSKDSNVFRKRLNKLTRDTHARYLAKNKPSNLLNLVSRGSDTSYQQIERNRRNSQLNSRGPSR